MRPEKKCLVDVVSKYLSLSDYVFLADFDKVTVADTAELRKDLKKESAEYHVVKNCILKQAIKSQKKPQLDEFLLGKIAVVFGGDEPSAVAKILKNFYEAKNKLVVKGGILNDNVISADEIDSLASLPDIGTLRAQFLSLLNTPAQRFLFACNGVPKNMVSVLTQYSKKTES